MIRCVNTPGSYYCNCEGGYQIVNTTGCEGAYNYRHHTQCITFIRESVDSLCRDGADTPMPPYIGKAFTPTNVEGYSLFRYRIMVCE